MMHFGINGYCNWRRSRFSKHSERVVGYWMGLKHVHEILEPLLLYEKVLKNLPSLSAPGTVATSGNNFSLRLRLLLLAPASVVNTHSRRGFTRNRKFLWRRCASWKSVANESSGLNLALRSRLCAAYVAELSVTVYRVCPLNLHTAEVFFHEFPKK